MNFIFEDKGKLENFIRCPDVNRSGIRRFAVSPLADMASRGITKFRHQLRRWFNPKQYIISSGVNHSPGDWAKDSIFQYLPARYLKDLREGRAMLLLDQSLEGQQTAWLWDYLHRECSNYKIPANAIIYATGNLLAQEQYIYFADYAGYTNRVNIIQWPIFEFDVWTMSEEHKIGYTFDDNVSYKRKNYSDIKTYNCLQKRLRPHRLWFYTKLHEEDLLKDGLVSQNPFKSRQSYMDGKTLTTEQQFKVNANLPSLVYNKSNAEFDDNYYIRRIVKDVYYDTWVSVVSEVAYPEQDLSVFISEKTFKAIVCCHPFILLSAKGSLAKLRAMGYKTFDGYIDETYDTLDTFDRLDAIAKELKRINEIPNKLAWYESMRDIVEHNYNLMKEHHDKKQQAIVQLEDCYKDYFKV